jgi:hypothetical protein
MLKNFSGVLVSDFYAVYDSIECPQQKCLIHFIRDLNEELLKHPYDDGLKQLGGDFAGLLKPMVETVDRHGLKKYFLGKHRIEDPHIDPEGIHVGRAQMTLGLLYKNKRKRRLALRHLTEARRILSQFGQTPILARVERRSQNWNNSLNPMIQRCRSHYTPP